MMCSASRILLIMSLALYMVVALEKSNLKCRKDIAYEENQCNGCSCQVDGTDELVCTLMACLSHQNPSLRQCEVGTTWKNSNGKQCWCIKDLGTLCEV